MFKKLNLRPGRSLVGNWLHPFALVNIVRTTTTEGAETELLSNESFFFSIVRVVNETDKFSRAYR